MPFVYFPYSIQLFSTCIFIIWFSFHIFYVSISFSFLLLFRTVLHCAGHCTFAFLSVLYFCVWPLFVGKLRIVAVTRIFWRITVLGVFSRLFSRAITVGIPYMRFDGYHVGNDGYRLTKKQEFFRDKVGISTERRNLKSKRKKVGIFLLYLNPYFKCRTCFIWFSSLLFIRRKRFLSVRWSKFGCLARINFQLGFNKQITLIVNNDSCNRWLNWQ